MLEDFVAVGFFWVMGTMAVIGANEVRKATPLILLWAIAVGSYAMAARLFAETLINMLLPLLQSAP